MPHSSSSAPTLRIRIPLASLPLSLFVSPASTLPSPVSLPLKRNATSAISSNSDASTSKFMTSPDRTKMRKITYADLDADETIKRNTRIKEVTPKAKAVLEHDDLGVGRSPARRLFVDGNGTKSHGITGAVSTPRQSSPVMEPPKRSLDPSPPIVSRTSDESKDPSFDLPATHTIPNVDNNINIHDPGFAFFSDATSHRTTNGVGIGTPDSRRHHPYPTLTSTSNPPLALDSSPVSSSRSYGSVYDENQENIPPPLSTTSTPSKHSSSSTISSPSSRHSKSYIDDDNALPSPGSGRNRTRTIERSKLCLETSIVTRNGNVDEGEDEDAEELTPGRRESANNGRKGKAKLAREVDRI